ncbi:MAG: methylcobamide--CoM methyltransferase [Candidatus Hydrogenedentota bacterium]
MTHENGRDRVLSAIQGDTSARLAFMPITMMFASDNAGVTYHAYATDHRVLVESQLRFSEDYDADHVSAISDPGREAADCGAAIQYFENQPPAVDENHARLSEKKELIGLQIPDPLGGGRMHDRVRAIERFHDRVQGDKLIEGWVEGPCAEAADLRGINTLMMDFYEDETFVRDLMAFCVEMGLQFGRAQLEAGADLIGVGDAAASLIGPDLYDSFVLPEEKRLVQGLQAMGGRVRLHICGNTTPILRGMGELGCEIVDLDYPASLAEARRCMPTGQVLLGNIDPVRVLKDGTPQSIYDAIAECHRQTGPGYIVGAGCEVPRGTRPENVRAMHQYAREHFNL